LPTLAQNSCDSRDFSSHEDTILLSYIAYYGRPADAAGMAYWAGRLEDEAGNLGSLIDSFGRSPEYNSRFAGLEFTTLVNNIFQQLFGRDADSGGLQYYAGVLESGERNLESIALDVMYGAQNDDETVVNNRLALSQFYVDGLETGGFIDFRPEQLSFYNRIVSSDEDTLSLACDSLAELPLDGDGFQIVIAVSLSENSKLTIVKSLSSSDSAAVVEELNDVGEPEAITQVLSSITSKKAPRSAQIPISVTGIPLSVTVENTRTEMTFNGDGTITLDFYQADTNSLIISLTKVVNNDELAALTKTFETLSSGASNTRAQIKVAKNIEVTNTTRELLLADYAASVTSFSGCALMNATVGLPEGEANSIEGVIDWAEGACLSTFFNQVADITETPLTIDVEITDIGEIDCDDNESCVEDVLEVIDVARPEAITPTGLNAIATDAQIALSWSGDEADSYNLYYSTVADGAASDFMIEGVTSPYSHTGLTNNTTYYYVIKGVYSGEESDPSSETSATPISSTVIEGNSCESDSLAFHAVIDDYAVKNWDAANQSGVYALDESQFDFYSEQFNAAPTDAFCQAALSYVYRYDGINKDGDQAFHFAELSANQSNTWGYEALVGLYFDGIGVEQDYDQAFFLASLSAANPENYVAQYYLGLMYKDGLGVAQNSETAFEWMSKSGLQGYWQAENWVAYMYREGVGTAQDDSESISWSYKSALKGNVYSQFWVGYHYYYGLGTSQSYTNAFEWFHKSALQQFAWSQYFVALAFYSGDGVEQDYELALEWATLSADQGNTSAINLVESINLEL